MSNPYQETASLNEIFQVLEEHSLKWELHTDEPKQQQLVVMLKFWPSRLSPGYIKETHGIQAETFSAVLHELKLRLNHLKNNEA